MDSLRILSALVNDSYIQRTIALISYATFASRISQKPNLIQFHLGGSTHSGMVCVCIASQPSQRLLRNKRFIWIYLQICKWLIGDTPSLDASKPTILGGFRSWWTSAKKKQVIQVCRCFIVQPDWLPWLKPFSIGNFSVDLMNTSCPYKYVRVARTHAMRLLNKGGFRPSKRIPDLVQHLVEVLCFMCKAHCGTSFP